LNILGVSWGICSSVALFQENCLTRAASEERFTRLKNDDVFPLKAIEYCLDALPGGASQLDGVALAGYAQGYWYSLKRKAHWTIDDYVQEQRRFWYPKLIEGKNISEKSSLEHRIDLEQYPSDYWRASLNQPDSPEMFEKLGRLQITAQAVGVDLKMVRAIEHHRCHAYYPYYGSSFRGEPVLALTIDGWGDGCNATIGLVDAEGNYKRVSQSVDANIGRIYRYMTLLLGMKPNEHEYKVMGLAPYAKKEIAQKPYEVFRSTLYVDGLEFKWRERPADSYFWFKDRLEGCRFDGIAAGLQRWVEELLCEWVRNAVIAFGIRKVVVGGGVAMNVKALGEIARIPEVDSMFVCGSPDDTSLALGAAYALAEDLSRERQENWTAHRIKPLTHLYLGPEYDWAAETAALAGLDTSRFKIQANYGPAEIAQYLAQGKVVARCAGRMEFGARALGNRSILADPIHLEVIPKINAAIKNRDFWMPFAPVIMDRFMPKYLVNPKEMESPFMTLAFATTDLGWKELPAACHPADHSARPQIITQETNPEVYQIMEEFSRYTGRGALLNTSFNLHGFPIVNTPQDAVAVFENSGLDILVLNNFLVEKIQP
jgi:carbamoyltransferase